eukprot:GFUD01043630.1.p1 GENE.GFUD01043630.1~~GFUD01043630.1.p1  ORF type:complete len:179 (+),score=25.25 GFUD01043630.1:79-615(+)
MLLPLILIMMVTAEAQRPNKITQEELRNVHKKSGLDRRFSFRCGMFFPDPKDASALPVGALLVLNATWPSDEDCQKGEKRYGQFCDSILAPLSNRLLLRDKSLITSNADKGDSIGDDVCGVLKDKVKAPFVGPKSKKFPRGIEFGMYTNSCGRTKWQPTGLKHREKVCCNDGKYIPCP